MRDIDARSDRDIVGESRSPARTSRGARRVAVEQEKFCFVVDDNKEFRESLLTLLEAAGYRARAFSSAAEFLALVDTLLPAVLLLDLRMPLISGLEMLEDDAIDLTRFAVVMISGHGDIERAVRSIKAGAIDFIEKPFEAAELLALIDVVQAGLVKRLDASAHKSVAVAKVHTLSPREEEVLRLLLTGAPNKIVARTLGLSVRTVEMHRAHMLTKLGARSTAEALHIAMLADTAPWQTVGLA